MCGLGGAGIESVLCFFFFFNREALLDEMREWSCGDAACEESSFLVAHGGGSVDDVVGTFC